MPTLKGTHASLSYVCFLYLVSSSINISICHKEKKKEILTMLSVLSCPEKDAKLICRIK